jgi:transcriptional regulator
MPTPPLAKAELLPGTLDLLILKTVALGPVHGYSIAQRIQQISKEVLHVRQGSLYPALHRLEEHGLLRAEWGTTESGREARFYRLSRRGRAQLERAAATWDQVARAIYAVLSTAE